MLCEVQFVKAVSIYIAAVVKFGRSVTHFLNELDRITSYICCTLHTLRITGK